MLPGFSLPNRKSPMVYSVNYEGYYTMSHHDREENALKRWFDNFKVDRNAWFATEFETLVVIEVNATAKHISKRQVCQIENVGYAKHKRAGASREVCMDHTAPPAPVLTFAAKRIWEPPPPKSPQELKREAEYERMYRLGYEPRRVPRYRPLTFNPYANPLQSAELPMDYDIEWVQQDFSRQRADAMRMAVMTMAPPAIDKSIIRQLEQMVPKHRRNA